MIRTTAKRSRSDSSRAKVRDSSPAARSVHRRRVKAWERGGRKGPRPKIKRRSRPGEPPAAPSRSPLNSRLFFSYDAATKGVVVGPARFRSGKVPRLLEFGGKTKRGKRRVVIAPRPFMRPAAEKVAPRLAGEFRNQILGP